GIGGRQTVLAAVGIIFLYSVVAIVVVGTVRGAARRAKTNALAYYARPDARPLFGLDLTEEQARAESMTLWPIGYMRLNQLLLWTFVASVSLIWFRVGLLMAGASLGFLIITGGKAIGKLIDDSK